MYVAYSYLVTEEEGNNAICCLLVSKLLYLYYGYIYLYASTIAKFAWQNELPAVKD